MPNFGAGLHAAGGVPRPRRLVLLFDGTWNKREDTTNVWRMRMLLPTNVDQFVYYDEGVGTAKGEVISGGAFGTGISGKVLNGYLWLMEHYESADESPTGQADEIYIFGFSRGATCARSLVGFISIAGLLHTDAATRIRDAFELSRLQDMTERHALSRDFRARHSRQVRVKFLGVWDTVQSLGVPTVSGLPQVRLPWFEHNALHKVVELPSIVDHARHAMAIDEWRLTFDVTLWPQARSHQTMEQRWFAGAHANVGGGYGRDALFQRPLRWLHDEAVGLGLQSRPSRVRKLGDEFYASAPRNPLDEIGYGAYHLLQKCKRHVRAMSFGGPTQECIDYTVLERWLWTPSYEPPQLDTWLGRKRRWRLPGPRLTDLQLRSLLSPRLVSPSRGYVF